MSTEIHFMRVPITGTMGCVVPVLPGTQDTDAPLEERTELCAIDADWLVGACPTCDLHAKLVCEAVDIDWSGVVAEAERDPQRANRPAEDRERHSQEDARAHKAHFASAAA